MAKITLEHLTINKYKSILNPQKVNIDPSITVLVGKNESGKTAFLTAIAKTNYFTQDEDFEFDIVNDYPRKELIDFQDLDEDCQIINCDYQISSAYLKEIETEFGKGVFSSNGFSYAKMYKSGTGVFSGIKADEKIFIKVILEKYSLSSETKSSVLACNSLQDTISIEKHEDDVDFENFKSHVTRICENGYENWENKLEGYIARNWIKSKMPKFWYFNEYYPLSGNISINKLRDQQSLSEKDKTSKALFEFARIIPDEVIQSTEEDYEKYIALLEASSNKITDEIFKYWSTNQNLDIEFKIKDINQHPNPPEKILDIRVKSQKHRITLPLDRRSKGFNWFFSFIVWFSKIQADKDSDYILLLDEPGLNLHASAQADLLRFIEDLSKKYQIIYTTHSPFMVDSERLDRVRTCYESDGGTIVSDSIQMKDADTLFPLQAALGYDIAQNLFISKNNLLVEGPSDLVYLTAISSIMESATRTALRDDITIVPVGGLDKVSTFISLLRGSKLNIACLLDTFTNQKGKQKVDDLVKAKIIKDKNIRFFNEFATNGKKTANIEDLFDPKEYIDLFNEAFDSEYKKIELTDLDTSIDSIIIQICKIIGKDRFNHYRPANKLNQKGIDDKTFSKDTLDRFEKVFGSINKLYPT